MPDPIDAPEAFGIDMDQLAGSRAFVAHDRLTRSECAQAVEAEPAQGGAHGGARQAKSSRNRWTGQALGAQGGDALDPIGSQSMRRTGRGRTLVPQGALSAIAEAPQPFVGCAFGHSNPLSGIR